MTRRSFALALAAALPLASAARKVRIGCQMNAFKDPASVAALEKLIESIKAAGYAGFETNVRNVRWDVAEVRVAIRRGGIAYIAPHTNLKLGVAGLSEAADRTADLGGERLVVSGAGGTAGEAEWKAKADVLNQAGEHCRKRGLVLIYHNHKPEFDSNAAEMESLIRNTKPEFVSFLMDAGHAHLAGVAPSAFLRKHPSRIDSIHLRNVDAAGKRLPLGTGQPDLALLAAEIRKLKWTGWLINEPELRTADTLAAETQIKADRNYIHKVFST